ncbi:hypothetical protein TI05_11545 [Achromatium sp. WMS3]|nr:hypothetical protein TI05_11545 [Achromatium sp. WMS3]
MALLSIASALKPYKYEIGGHTDSRGSAVYNLKLSIKRAKAIRKTLCRKYDVDCNNLLTRGYGEAHPIASNSSRSGRSANRRVSIKRVETTKTLAQHQEQVSTSNEPQVVSNNAHVQQPTPTQSITSPSTTEANVKKVPENVQQSQGSDDYEFTQAMLLIDQGQYAQALPLLQQAANRGEAMAQTALAVMYWQGQGVTKNPDQAFKWANKAAKQGDPNAQFVLAILYVRGIGTNKNPELAVQWLRKAAAQGHENALAIIAQLKAQQESPPANNQPQNLALQQAKELNSQVVKLYQQGKYAEAVPLAKQALAISEQALGTNHPDVANGLNNLAALYTAQGQYQQAEPLYQRSLKIREQALGANHPDVAASLHNLAELYRAQGQYQQAEPLYQRSLKIWEQALGANHPDVATSLNNLAGFYYVQRQYAKALDYVRRASRIYQERIVANSREATSGGDKERTGFKGTFGWHLGIAAARVAEAPELRDELTAESFAISQLFHAGSVGNAVAQMAARFASGSSALADLARAKEDTQTMWLKTEADLITAIGKPNDQQNPTLIQNLRTRSQELKTQLDALNQRLAQEFPDYAELTIPQPTAIDQVQRLLKPGEGLVSFALGVDKSFVWLITPDQISFRQIERSANDIAKQVNLLRDKLSPDPDKNDRLRQAFPVTIAHALYQDILAPEAARLANIKTLFVVPDGALESLPFSVLVTKLPTGNPEDYQNVAWLSRAWATVTLPTVSSLRALRTLATKGQTAPQPFVGFGDPKFEGDPSANRDIGGIRLVGDINSGVIPANRLSTILSPLPDTAKELRANAKTLGAGANSIFLQEQASIPQVRRTRLTDYRVVQFATHALVAGQIQQFQLGQAEPAIALTPPPQSTKDNDGLLRASQIAADLKLNADWVVLSACNTAAPDGSSGAPGLSGLAKAFFYAGAKAMLVSHWSIVSQPAVVLTGHMFQQWQDNPQIGRAEALRRAQMYVLDNPDYDYYKHPGSWAPFVVAGEGGVGR